VCQVRIFREAVKQTDSLRRSCAMQQGEASAWATCVIVSWQALLLGSASCWEPHKGSRPAAASASCVAIAATGDGRGRCSAGLCSRPWGDSRSPSAYKHPLHLPPHFQRPRRRHLHIVPGEALPLLRERLAVPRALTASMRRGSRRPAVRRRVSACGAAAALRCGCWDGWAAARARHAGWPTDQAACKSWPRAGARGGARACNPRGGTIFSITGCSRIAARILSSPPHFGQCSASARPSWVRRTADESDDPEAAAAEYRLLAVRRAA
jgi:hypothetical protein